MNSHHSDQVEVSGSCPCADSNSTLDSHIPQGLTQPVPSIALVAPSEAGILEEAMATPFDSILDLDVLSLEVTPSSCTLPDSDTNSVQIIVHDPEQNTTLESSKCPAFSQPLCEPSPGTEIMSTESFNAESSAELLESNACDVSSSGVLANDFTVSFPNNVTDPEISSEQVESIVLDIQPPPSYDDVECTFIAYSDEAKLASKPLSSETANKRPARISMLPKLCLPQPVPKSLNEELLGRPGSEQDDQKHGASSVEKDSDSGFKKPVLLGKLLQVTSDATFFPNIGTGKLEAWIPVFNPSFVSSVVFRSSIKTTWRDFMEPTMGVIPPRGSKIIVAHADPSKHPKDIGKSLANEVIKLELFPTNRIATKFSEFFSLWKKHEGPVEVIRMSDFTVSSTPRKVEVPAPVNHDPLLMKQNGNETKPLVGTAATPGDKKGCHTSGIPTYVTRKPVAKETGEYISAAPAPMTETSVDEVNSENSEFEVEKSPAANDGGETTDTNAGSDDSTASSTSKEETEQVAAGTTEHPAPAEEEKSISWFDYCCGPFLD